MIDKLIAQVARVSRGAAWVGGAAMMVAALIVTFEVLSRKFLNWSMAGADELSGYIFAVATAWSFAYAMLERANVRIDGIYLLAPTSLRAVMDIGALLALGLYVAAMLHSGWILWLDNYTFDSRSITSWRTPLAIPQALWLAGWAWLGVALVLVLVRCLQALARGRLAEVVAVAGVRTMEEEVAAEVAHAAEEVAHERELRGRSGDR